MQRQLPEQTQGENRMKKYVVYVVEQVTRAVEIEAESKGSAISLSENISDREWDYQSYILESVEAEELI